MALKKLIFIMLLCPLLMLATPAKANEQSDVRIIIDVSGSMKHNDPANLRAPALRMVVGLMPERSPAGVWVFAKTVNTLVPWKPINDEWRQHAVDQSEKIHSRGLYTDIEQALDKATGNLKNGPASAQRSIILLSDGFVDLQAGTAATAASRQRILSTLLPRLKHDNVTVHTIALSSQADHELLKKLAVGTDGWYEQADSAEQLQRIFLRMFEKATHRDTVPLVDNQFIIDTSVKEMTILAFRQPSSEPTQLISPEGNSIAWDNITDQIKWQHEAAYDLITVKQPAIGKWQLDAELDPDNRVMVVTDMKMETTTLPNNVLAGESFDLEARLTEKGAVITRPDFLNLVDAELMREREGEVSHESFVRYSEQAVYRTTLGETLKPGNNEIIVTMHSATFQRQRRQIINVVASPLNIQISPIEADSRSHRIDLSADEAFLNVESLTATGLLRDDSGVEWPYTLFKTDNNHWRLTLTDLNPEQRYELSLQVKGQTPEGRVVFMQTESLPLLQDSVVMSSHQQSEQKIMPDIPAMVEIPLEPVVEDITIEKQGKGLSDIQIFLIGNIIIVCLLIVGVRWWRKQNAALAKIVGELA